MWKKRLGHDAGRTLWKISSADVKTKRDLIDPEKVYFYFFIYGTCVCSYLETIPEVVPVITSKVRYCVPFCYDSSLLAILGQRNLCPRVNTAVICLVKRNKRKQETLTQQKNFCTLSSLLYVTAQTSCKEIDIL